MAWPDDPLTVEVSLELGADLTADPSGYAFATDITSKTFDRSGDQSIVITRGRQDESVVSEPSSCSLLLDNTNGHFSPRNPLGDYYPDLRRNTPIRVRVNPGSGLDTRFTGYLSDLPPRWDPSENDQWVPVTANGVLRRLGQGASPLKSCMFRAIQASGPLGHWALEDGESATTAAEASGGTPMTITGGVTFGTAGAAGAASMATLSATSRLEGTPPRLPSTGQWSVARLVNIPTVPGAATPLLNWRTTGTYPTWRLVLTPGSPDTLALQAFDAAGTLQINSSITFATATVTEPYGVNLLIVASASQNGTAVDWQWMVMDTSGGSGASGSAASTTTGVVKFVAVGKDAGLADSLAGHVAVWDYDLNPTGAFALDNDIIEGFTGERVSVRFMRLCDEESVAREFTNLSNQFMGPQTPKTFLDLLRECESAEAGLLLERRSGLLALQLHTSRENKPPALVIDYDAGHVSQIEPTDDDQRTRNDVTVNLPGGTSGRVALADGPLGVDAVGRYDEQVTINLDPSDPDLAIHHAGWRVNLGTVDKLRFPTITVNIRRNDDLVADWLALDIGSRIDLVNLPNHISYDDVPLIVEGYTEQISQKNWIVTFNCAPYDPYIVGVLAEDDIMLLTAEDTTSTSWRIGSEPPFTKSADRPGDFPVALGINGEEVSATAAAAVGMNFAAGTPAHADNASVVCTWPSHVEGDLLVGFAAIRNTGVGSPNLPAGYTSIYAPTSQRIFGKYATSSAESNPTVTFSGGAAGDTCSVVPLRLRGLQIDLVNSKEQSNGSAQDVAIPHFVQEGDVQVLLFWWKQDDMTSATPPTGISNELVEATTAVGNDQTLYVAYQNTASDAAPVPAGSSVVTGGAAAVSRATILALRRGVTDLTVERSVNGVVTSHAQLSAFEVHEPMNLAL